MSLFHVQFKEKVISMKKLFLALTLYCLLIFPSLMLTAQDEADTGWPIEQRCVGDPTPPPEDWTFEGTILMEGNYGIHAVSVDFETPYVVVFLPPSRTLSGGNALSPDGRWYAALEGESDFLRGGGLGAFEAVSKIIVYSTEHLRQAYEMDWHNLSIIGSQGLNQSSIVWLDNEYLVFPQGENDFSRINPFTNENEAWGGIMSPFDAGFRFFQSPDWSRAVINRGLSIYDDNWGVYDPITGESFTHLNSVIGFVGWKPDSSYFVAKIQVGDEIMPDYQLALFNRNGGFIEVIYNPLDTKRLGWAGRSHLVWSSDGRYLAFHDEDFKLYIADMEMKQIIDLCRQSYGGISWSPDSQQVVFMAINPWRRQSPIVILDVPSMNLYTVAYHRQGDLIGWRAD